MLRKLEDLSPADWIKDETDAIELRPEMWRGNFVSHCVPKIFPTYCKILHPMYEDLSVTDREISWNDLKVRRAEEGDPVAKLLNESTTVYAGPDEVASLQRIRWRELAGQRGLTFHPEINVETFSRNFAGRSWPRYLIGPEEGILELEMCSAMVRVLSTFTRDEELCYFRYDLITTDDYENDLLYCGSLQDVFAAREVANVHASPTNWWPQSRSWFIHTDYDLTFTLVGGPKALTEALIANPVLEAVEVVSSHRVDFQADRVNA